MGQSIWSHLFTPRAVAESAVTDRILLTSYRDDSAYALALTTPRGSQRPFRVEHVVSYPDRYSPAFAFSAIPCPLSRHAPCGSQTPAAHPQGKTTGLPSSTTMTRWGGCCLSTGGVCVSVTRKRNQAIRPHAVLAQAHTATFACQ